MSFHEGRDAGPPDKPDTTSECPFCRGTGRCGRCDGTGSHVHRTRWLRRLRRVACTACNGSGATLGFVRPFDDFPFQAHADIWDDTRQSGFGDAKIYVVQTAMSVIQRCVLMTTDPGDLVLDPTCGSGTTATIAEHWGRRWVTIDTSRVALTLARSRVMGARYPYYKEAIIDLDRE